MDTAHFLRISPRTKKKRYADFVPAREASPLIKDIARQILRYLRKTPWGASKERLCNETGVSAPSIQRALTWLRDHCDSPLDFDRSESRWILRDPHFTLPLSDPEPDDLNAVLFAEALLGSIADEDITARLRRLAEQMDSEIRESPQSADSIRHDAVIATITTASHEDPKVLNTLLKSVGKHSIRIRYRSPWSEKADSKTHLLEAWQLRVHDGSIYMRAWSPEHQQARSYRVAQIEEAEPVQTGSRQPLPPQSLIWGPRTLAFGIDHDRPDTAIIQIRSPTARWVQQNIWHSTQKDRWIEDKKVLERTLPYHSCRELARRLLSLGKDLIAVHPPALKDELRSHLKALQAQLAEPPLQP